ncbi:hypothetical protein BV25DRAFT_1823353 [Artomyces pyxidatus]|uniref:Uncharacterized protein n=1 Tax=Artomyces pyxidatus TaxID=48021 RepID=A0ACB8T7B5_9AGAM|nr:hypothetical protein BV25DRAFT_1823353 [Artomyces pyxidatus]
MVAEDGAPLPGPLPQASRYCDVSALCSVPITKPRAARASEDPRPPECQTAFPAPEATRQAAHAGWSGTDLREGDDLGPWKPPSSADRTVAPGSTRPLAVGEPR